MYTYPPPLPPPHPPTLTHTWPDVYLHCLYKLSVPIVQILVLTYVIHYDVQLVCLNFLAERPGVALAPRASSPSRPPHVIGLTIG